MQYGSELDVEARSGSLRSSGRVSKRHLFKEEEKKVIIWILNVNLTSLFPAYAALVDVWVLKLDKES